MDWCSRAHKWDETVSYSYQPVLALYLTPFLSLHIQWRCRCWILWAETSLGVEHRQNSILWIWFACVWLSLPVCRCVYHSVLLSKCLLWDQLMKKLFSLFVMSVIFSDLHSIISTIHFIREWNFSRNILHKKIINLQNTLYWIILNTQVSRVR